MGGSESRFVMSPAIDHRDRFIYSSDHNSTTPLSFGNYNVNDRFQKFVIKADGERFNLRFDNHPQPYWYASGNDVKMSNGHNDAARWAILPLGKKNIITFQGWVALSP